MTLSASEWADSVSIIPIESKGKKPLIPWKEYTERIAPREERAEWRKRWPGCNWGLVTGSISSYTVLDFDKDEGRALFNEYKVAGTCPVNITANGYHALFAVEADPIGNATRIAPGLDVRGKRLHRHPAVNTSHWQALPMAGGAVDAPSCASFARMVLPTMGGDGGDGGSGGGAGD